VQQGGRADRQIHIVQGDLRRRPGELGAAPVATHGGHQAAFVQGRQQTPDHHGMSRQAGGELFGGTRTVLADQMGHHVQRIGELVAGFHVTIVVTY